MSVCERVIVVRVLPESSSVSSSSGGDGGSEGIASRQDTDARMQELNGIHTDEETTRTRSTHGEDGIKTTTTKQHFTASTFSFHFCPEHPTSSSTSENTYI